LPDLLVRGGHRGAIKYEFIFRWRYKYTG